MRTMGSVHWILNRSNQLGGVVIRVAFAVVTLLVIGGAIFAVLSRNQTNQQVYHRKAQEISEYGLMQALQTLRDNPSWTSGLGKTEYEQGWYTVSVQKRQTNGTSYLTIISVGTMKSLSVSKEFILKLDSADGKPTWTRESIQ